MDINLLRQINTPLYVSIVEHEYKVRKCTEILCIAFYKVNKNINLWEMMPSLNRETCQRHNARKGTCQNLHRERCCRIGNLPKYRNDANKI
jgi:hypothetical protein